MSAVPQSMSATSLDRRIQMLRTAMGPLIAAALEDPDVVEVMLNPDRTLWVDRLSSGRAPMGVELPEADGERIIRLVAAHVGAEVHRGQPLLSAELPETGERFEGILPPAAPGPAFALRKRAIGVIPLERYVIDGMMTSAQAGFLVRAVRERQNVLIAGATSSGKTTLANALLAEIAATGDRVLVLEDTVELQCAARDHVPLRTRAGVVSMTELVRSSMRLRPDRVVVGEVRGAEALDLIKVWGRPSRRHRHDPCRLRARRAAAPGATDSRSGGESAPCADRRGGQRGDPHRRARAQAPHREHRPRRRLRRRGLPTGGCAGNAVSRAAATSRCRTRCGDFPIP